MSRLWTGNLSGNTPTGSEAVDGDFLLDYSSGAIWGPRVNGTWPAQAGTLGSPNPLPFFGKQTSVPWVRPALATFSSWLNQTDSAGTALAPTTATATDNTGGLPLILTGGLDTGATPFPTLLVKALPTVPYTITVAMATFAAFAGGFTLPIALFDNTNHKVSALQWYYNGSQAPVWVYHYSNVNNYATCSAVIAGSTDFPFPDYFEWFRIVNDGTKYHYYISPDGLLFKEFYNETIGSFLTATAVGFGIDRSAQAAGVSGVVDQSQTAILWSWVETNP